MVKSNLPDFSGKYLDAGRIQMLNIVGAGTFGCTYRALEWTPGQIGAVTRAVKVMLIAEPGTRRAEYQERETILQARVAEHPNIAKVHRTFKDEKYMYLVMDFFAGGDLFRVITRKRTLARNDALIRSVALQIIDGVEACHAQGVYHRDLKPENILCNEDLSQVCIADFGLATTTRLSTSFHTGSVTYMSPECVDCNDPDFPYDTRRSDVWAIGVILITLVSGRTPWKRATYDDELFTAFLDEPAYFRFMIPISPALDAILHAIFTEVPSEAIALADLRRRLAALDSFYLDEDERATMSENARHAWDAYQPPLRVANDAEAEVAPAPPPLALVDSSSAGSGSSAVGARTRRSSSSSSSWNSLEDDSDDSDEHSTGLRSAALLALEEGQAAPAPPISTLFSPVPPPSPRPRVVHANTGQSSVEFPIRARQPTLLAPSSGPSSADASRGPRTPAIVVLDPEGNVSDMEKGEAGGKKPGRSGTLRRMTRVVRSWVSARSSRS